MLYRNCCLIVFAVLLFSPAAMAQDLGHLWSQRFGDANFQRGARATTDASGNVIATGYFAGTADFGGGLLTSAGGWDIFVTKFDPNGNHVWSQRFGNASDQLGVGVATDASGNVIVTGYFAGTVNFGGGLLTSAGLNDIFVVKFDTSGNYVWGQRFGDVSDDVARSVATGPSGNVIVTGSFAGTVDFGGGVLTSAGGYDIFVAKFNTNGIHAWSDGFGGTGAQLSRSVTTDPPGNVIVTGYFADTVDFGGGVLTSSGGYDIFVAKFNTNGVHAWSDGFGGAGDQLSRSVAADPSGNVIVTGWFEGTVDFGGGVLTSAGLDDIFVAKFDPSGNHVWSQQFGDASGERAHGVAADAWGNVIVTGWIEGTVDFGGGGLTSAGLHDIFVVKFFSSPPIGTYEPHEMPHQDFLYISGLPPLTSSAVDTFHLASFDFEIGSQCDPEGWTSMDYSGRGDLAQLYPGLQTLQEDECFLDLSCLWGFFDLPTSTNYACHTPVPRPDVGAVPFVNTNGLHVTNEIWSPWIPNTGSGYDYRLRFLTYRDLPLDNVVFYVWHVRSRSSGVQGDWRDRGLAYYGGRKDWIRVEHSFGDLIDPDDEEIQIALGVWDMCSVWCGVFGSGACHSHAPLFDEVRVDRIATFGPQYGVRHIDLFQDNFAEDGSLSGTARADAAIDILPSTNPGIQPGDSVTLTIAPVHGPPGSGPSAWIYARVNNMNAPKSGAGLGSPDTRAGKAGLRYPHIGSWIDANSKMWDIFQTDSVIAPAGVSVPDRYCVDLNDGLFVPGDTILYFFGADADGTSHSGNEVYWHRELNGQGDDNVTADINEAAASPCEFTILPAGGHNRGGDILYVDDTDDRGGPAQLFFDSAFDLLGIRGSVDRFDVLGPSSAAGNSLASRVKGITSQIIDPYKKIIWNSGDLSSGTIGDGWGGNPEKSDDFCLLYQFVSAHPNNPGLYISGDDVAQEWVTSGGCASVPWLPTYMSFNLLADDHTIWGEPVSPHLTGIGAPFMGDVLVAFGGCPSRNDFDVLQPTGPAITQFAYPIGGDGAIISQQTPNGLIGSIATVVLSGFSYHYTHDAAYAFPPARVEFLRDVLVFLGNIVPEVTGIDPEVGPELANYLDNNYPNPFNPETTIRYGVKVQTHVSLNIYNVAGRLVKTLVDESKKPAVEYKVTWNGDNNSGQPAATGVYFYKLVTGDFTQTKKMVYLK